MFDSLSVDFANEALELLRQLEEALLALERGPAETDSAAIAAHAQRLLHTLKGNAGLVGAVELQHALHRLEDQADPIPAAEVPAVLLPALDVIRAEVQALAAGRAVDTPLDALKQVGRGDAAVAAATPAAGSDSVGEELRVPQARVDALLAAAGDLLVQNGRLQRLATEPGSNARALRDAADALHAGLRAVHAELLRLRTVPVSRLFERFRRLVRDDALAHQKQARLTVTGGEVGADKAVLDALGGALVHLIRNAIAHGIESPDRRTAAGKPAEGEVRLGAALRGALLEITVEDDGAGFDRVAIAQRALELGRDPHADAGALIFEPGFSTATLSESAGRGVGLDAVRAAAYALAGSVEASSEPGRGARFILRVPATIALQRALLCAIGVETYAIPSTSVLEATRLQADQVRWLGRGQALDHRLGLVPLIESERHLGARSDGPFAVVLSAGGLAALRVDALLGEQEFVFQPVPPEVRGRGPVSGGALLSDGRVVLRLSAEGLVAASGAATHAGAEVIP